MFSYLEQVVIGVAAPWATKALRPTGRFQGVPALLIGAKLRKECRQRQAWLELDTVHGHGSFSLVVCWTNMRLIIEKSGLAEESYNQVRYCNFGQSFDHSNHWPIQAQHFFYFSHG